MPWTLTLSMNHEVENHYLYNRILVFLVFVIFLFITSELLNFIYVILFIKTQNQEIKNKYLLLLPFRLF